MNDLTTDGFQVLEKQALIAIKSGMLPQSIRTPEQAITIALKGRELGIPMMQAFSQIHVIQGKPTISSELMLALIYKNCKGAVVNYLANDATRCTIEAYRLNHKPNQFTFSMEDAKLAGLLVKDTWKKYPDAMLRARCIAIVARAVFPDAIMGCSYTPEEMGAVVTDEGEVVSVDSKPVKARDADLIGNGTVGDKPGMITYGTYRKKNLNELSEGELRDFIRLAENAPQSSMEQLQDVDRAKHLLTSYAQVEPLEQALPTTPNQKCDCGEDLKWSTNKNVWYCGGFKNPGEHFKPRATL